MAEEGGLEEWNYGIQISAGVSGDQSMGWVGRSQAPARELGTGLGFRVEVQDV